MLQNSIHAKGKILFCSRTKCYVLYCKKSSHSSYNQISEWFLQFSIAVIKVDGHINWKNIGTLFIFVASPNKTCPLLHPSMRVCVSSVQICLYLHCACLRAALIYMYYPCRLFIFRPTEADRSDSCSGAGSALSLSSTGVFTFCHCKTYLQFLSAKGRKKRGRNISVYSPLCISILLKSLKS